MMAPARPVKITFAEMREQGVRGILIYCAGLPLQPLNRDQRRSMPRCKAYGFIRSRARVGT
jgi:hypothetical protein